MALTYWTAVIFISYSLSLNFPLRSEAVPPYLAIIMYVSISSIAPCEMSFMSSMPWLFPFFLDFLACFCCFSKKSVVNFLGSCLNTYLNILSAFLYQLVVFLTAAIRSSSNLPQRYFLICFSRESRVTS